jgi:hypothetical protein
MPSRADRKLAAAGQGLVGARRRQRDAPLDALHFRAFD